MSSSSQLPLDAFPAWARLNDVTLAGIELQHVDGKGCGFVVSKELQVVQEYAKVDSNFKQLLEVVGHKSVRIDAMLYLLCHLIHSRRGQPTSRGITSTPWTEYVRFLPRSIPTPTMWSEPERLLLNGTSLEAALSAKLSALANEFDELRAQTEAMPFWDALLWEHGTASLDDWVLVDAWYRSRCLELPQIGDAMVPGLDMVNHSGSPSAYYEVDGNADVVLYARPDCAASCGREVAISYGENKSAAEMLFSYGFVDRHSTARNLALPLDPFPDDPLAKAKVHVFGGPRTVRVTQDDQRLEWQSPFVYLMCLNEEDGLEFRLLQDTEGERQLRLLWQGSDMTDRATDLEALIQNHPLCQVFRLRAVAVVHERIETQLARIKGGPSDDELQPLMAAGLLREECIAAARTLREVETCVLEAAAEALESEKSTLLAHDHVVAYLGSVEDGRNDEAPLETTPNEEEDDFS
ncbi:SET domain-containing protein [Hirsutella rhossiliensis]|uniref:SET domain-containing protein n=1 Tax=Hirsutella rhossiliensis TaxID=111463 RepID=A0A9P8N806_9HYPO|nr:SET domain-containing protein [Hirsutella rhossiliensis]KAH0967661.1 SET domain-containing protein [Hirsutella rhossiliensis]